jgi:hypothetical protein
MLFHFYPAGVFVLGKFFQVGRMFQVSQGAFVIVPHSSMLQTIRLN